MSTKRKPAARRDSDPVRVYRDGRVAYWDSGVPGKGKRRYERHDPGAPAEARAEELRIRIRSIAKLGPKAWRTLDQAFQDMLIQKRSVKAEEGSIRQYKTNWNAWIPEEIGETVCLDADLSTWTAIFDHANAEGASETTVRSIGRTVGTLAKWGVARGYFGPEPFGGILQRQVVLSEAKGVARVVAAELRKDYSPAMCPTVADVEKFAAAFEAVYPGYGERLVKLAFASGLRINELLALEHDSIDFETNLISVDWQLDRYNHWPARKLPKYKKRRKAFLRTAYLDVARSLVEDSLARDPEDCEYGRLFPRHRSVVSWAEQAGKLSGEAIKAAEWAWTFHWLRHAYASYSLLPVDLGGYGFAVASVQAWLGHAKPSTTQDMYVQRQVNDVDIAKDRTALPPGLPRL